MKAIKHFRTITKHKYYVMKLCFRFGLYKQEIGRASCRERV